MQTIDPSLNSIFSAYVFIGGCFLILMWIGSVLYLKYKWLSFVEKQSMKIVIHFLLVFFLQDLEFQDTHLFFNLIGKQGVAID